MRTLGVTGEPASGKTEALLALAVLGARVMNSDRLVRKLSARGTPAYAKIVRRFGRGICGGSGAIERRRLREEVRRDPRAMIFLERLFHPLVKKEARSLTRRLKARPGLLAVEVPLLFEAGMAKYFDRVLCVRAGRLRERARSRRKGWSGSDFDFFCARHLPAAEKARRSDFVVQNDGSLAALRKRIRRVYEAAVR